MRERGRLTLERCVDALLRLDLERVLERWGHSSSVDDRDGGIVESGPSVEGGRLVGGVDDLERPWGEAPRKKGSVERPNDDEQRGTHCSVAAQRRALHHPCRHQSKTEAERVSAP